MTPDQAALLSCRLPGCDGPRSGVCINNLPFDDCPDVVLAAEADAEDVHDDPTSAAPAFVELRGGASLDVIACDALLRERGGTIISLVAGPEVGKTTLIAIIYELIQRRRMRSFGFAGSETLRGYEERCHLARLASGSPHPDTRHTPVGAPLSFTHLRVATSKDVQEVVFADRSGEHFDNALSNPGAVCGFVEIARADAVLILVDLNELVTNPHQPTSNVRRLFMSMDQAGLLQSKKVILTGTKADLVDQTPRSRRGRTALTALATDLTRRSRSGPVDRAMVACRPKAGSTEIGQGVEELLAAILERSRPVAQSSTEAWPDKPNELEALMLGYRARRT